MQATDKNMLAESLRKWEEGDLAESMKRVPERPETQAFQRLHTPLDAGPQPPDEAEQQWYLEKLGFPGQYPFTRGVQPTMYRSRFWTMRQYAGYGTAAEANERFKYLLGQGQTGLSIAFDLATQIGYDSDDPLASGEVGQAGVAIDSLADMEALLDGIPLDKVSISMTINAPASVLLAMVIAAGEKRGVPAAKLTGTIQNDILKEYVARGTYIFPPGPSVRLAADTIAYCARAGATVERHQRQRLPHPRRRQHGRAGDGLRPGQRHRLHGRRAGARDQHRRLRLAHLLDLQHPEQLLRGGGQVPRPAPAVGHDPARAVRRQEAGQHDAAHPHPDRRRNPDRPAAAEQHRPRRLPGAGQRARRHPKHGVELLRRSPGTAHRGGPGYSAAHPADHRPRDRRHRGDRPVGRLLLRRKPDRHPRSRGAQR